MTDTPFSVPSDGPIICTITGDPGTGKTRLAATFPRPVFLRAEDGMKSIPADVRPPASPLLNSPDDLWKFLTWLIHNDHDFKTVVVDSVTQLETLFADHVIENDPKKPKSLATAMGGYGAGYQAVSAMHGRVRKAADLLQKKGMHVVFIAHSETTTIELPDMEPYTRYDLRLHKKSVTHYVDNVDMVAHIRLQTFLKGDGEKKKAVSTDDREVVVAAGAAQVSKNRFSITDVIPAPEGVNPFTNYIPSLQEK